MINMACKASSYSGAVKKSIGKKTSKNENDNDDERDLVEKIRKLKQALDSIDYPNIKQEIEEIAKASEKVLENHEKDRNEIKELKERVFNLEQEIERLRRANVDAVETGEAMKMIEVHVATFVFPVDTKIAKSDGFGQINECAKDKTSKRNWKILQDLCGMQWQDGHVTSKNQLIASRNKEAHHKKFDLALLTKAMIDQLPHYKKQCQDFVSLFEKVNSLMKFGMLASEKCIFDAVKRNFSKEHIDLIHAIKMECYRDVYYLQDIEIEQAKRHLVEYFAKRSIPTSGLADIIDVIKETNRLRLGQLVKQSEMQIASSLLQNPAQTTFDDVDKKLAKNKTKNEFTRRSANRWKLLTEGKEWSEDHSTAIRELKNMPAKKQNEKVDPLPIHIAQLHLPDFLDKKLWKAGSDVLEIFEKWKKRNP